MIYAGTRHWNGDFCMRHIGIVQKRFSLVIVLLLLAIIVIAASFGVHCHKVNKYNSVQHSIASGESDGTGVSVNIHPRGQSTDKWDKQDEVLGVTTKGIIFEATVTNASKDEISEWTLDLDFAENYFVNNAWCGTLEIHQNSDEGEQVQTLDLRNTSHDEIELNHHIAGNDIMIDLTPGSSIIYHPSITDNEAPLDSGSNINPGIILYSYTDTVDISNCTLEYKLHRNYLDGSGQIYLYVFVLWIFAVIMATGMMLMSQRYEKHLQERDNLVCESLDVFAKFVDAKDPYTEGHSERVAENARLIAERLGLKERECQEIFYSALLHDIGKCYVPDEILKKPSRLTDEEFATIKTHTTLGAQMLENFTAIPAARDAAICHHERYDGRGYPNGLSGEDIPLIGRILCVADSYDAMNSDRVYRKKLSREIIVSELEKNRGTQFDPKIVDVFLEVLNETPENN